MDVFHRILCFEKKFHIRLNYRWKSLWSVLLQLIRSVNNQFDLTRKGELFSLINKVHTHSQHTNDRIQDKGTLTIQHQSYLKLFWRLFKPHLNLNSLMQTITILNMFITFGNNFLPNLNDYDDLYYELIRCREDLAKLYEIGTFFDGFSNWNINLQRITKNLCPFRKIPKLTCLCLFSSHIWSNQNNNLFLWMFQALFWKETISWNYDFEMEFSRNQVLEREWHFLQFVMMDVFLS